ncbi:hypothetical protein L1987_29091 [Smallanthus sonchifolius]|uniref:Uncharacterized protein n=1 Tax=Smallanthus sonchifolius TaxID=185202 RepID=A0ACB9HZS6_9ASTR|nr:hypothetical protein L1987_29091 [Smallanthus sonchifolius]
MSTGLFFEFCSVNSYRNVFLYLAQVCKRTEDGHQNPFVGEIGVKLLRFLFSSGSFDVAYDLLKYYPELASTTSPDDNMTPLQWLAMFYPSRKAYNFYQRFVYSHVPAETYSLDDAIKKIDTERNYSIDDAVKKILGTQNQGTYWANIFTKSFVYSVIERIYLKIWKVAQLLAPHIKQLQKDKVNHNLAFTILKFMCEETHKSNSVNDEQLYDASLGAVMFDKPEVLELITRISPQLIWTRGSSGYSLAQFSILNRSVNAYNVLINKVPLDIVFVDDNGNNFLHLAGKRSLLSSTHGTGAALQMQRELQWFQEVSDFVRPMERTGKNFEQETPIMVFKKEHENLRRDGEEWMKKRANLYTITAALIITIVLAAAFNVPGGYKAVYETRSSFNIFAVSDVMSLITSTTSLLLFRSLLTARYADEDFLYNLPNRLMLGLVMLFMSTTTMLIAFSATFYTMFWLESSWILIVIGAITCLSIALFVALQLPFLVELISSTYGRGMFRKRSELRTAS